MGIARGLSPSSPSPSSLDSPPPPPHAASSDSRGSSLDRVSSGAEGAGAEGGSARGAAGSSGPGTPDGTSSAAEAAAEALAGTTTEAAAVGGGAAGENASSTTTSTAAAAPNKLIVLGLPWATTDASLASHFSTYGELFFPPQQKEREKRKEEQEEEKRELEGGGYLSKAAEKVEKVSRKGASKVKKASKATGKYVTDVNGLASDVVNYGIPAASSATLGALGAATGNPLIGVAASALGSKLGTMAAYKIAKETVIQSRTGEGVKPKRKPRFEKGSAEAKEHMAKLREARKKKE